MICNARDLSPGQKVAIESLLGRSISDDEEISVRALHAPEGVSPQRRAEILDALKAHFARVDARRLPVPSEEAENIINEALRSTRPDYRPVR
jgi:hypothetical protein